MPQLSKVGSEMLDGALPSLDASSLTSIPAGNLTGTVADARISTLSSSKLSGALPAISGASLTNLDARDLENALPAISGASLTSLPVTGANTSLSNLATAGEKVVALSWVQFNGSSFAIQDSYNVSSCTDVGTGNYLVLLSHTMPNNDYCIVASSGEVYYGAMCVVNNVTTTQYRQASFHRSSGYADCPTMCSATFGYSPS